MLAYIRLFNHIIYLILINGYEIWCSDKVAACAKHYVGDGGTTKGINENNTRIDWNGLLKIHMPGYVRAINQGVATIMVSYSSWNGHKMHANHLLITRFLKGTLKFKVQNVTKSSEFCNEIMN